MYCRSQNNRLALVPAIFAALCIVLLASHPACAAPAARAPGSPGNIALDFLDMEKPLGAGSRHCEYVSGLMKKAAARVPVRSGYGREEAIRTLKAIDALLRDDGFVFKNNLLLHRGIDGRTIDCDNYCALYIAIAEELKIPIVPVYAPNHGFLRFYLDDGSYLNWETTTAAAVTDRYYIDTLRIAADSLRQGVYLQTLERKEFIGVEYNNIGAHLMSGRKFQDAVPYFSMAIRCYPKFASAYHNRGSALYAIRRAGEAMKDLLVARDLDPARPSTRNTLGDIYFDRKEYAKAVGEYRAAIALEPGNYVPYHNMGLLLKETGNEDESRRWLERAKKIREGGVPKND